MPKFLHGSGTTYLILQTTASYKSYHDSTLVEGTIAGRILDNSQLSLGREGNTSLIVTLVILN